MGWFPSGPEALIASDKTVPRLHLAGTLLLVLGLTLALAGFFSWQNLSEQQASLARLETLIRQQQQARLTAEMQSAMSYLAFVRSRTEEVLRRSLVEQVDGAMQLVEALHAREAPRRSAAEVRRLIVETLRPQRFYDGRGYYFIDDLRGRFVLLPTDPSFEGRLLPDNRDDSGHFIMRGLIEAARQPRGQGFSRYRWFDPERPRQMADKLAYVRHFAPYDWLVGTGDYLHKWEERQQREALAHLRSLRFGVAGHFSLLDREGRVLLLPAHPGREGRRISDLPRSQRANLEKIALAGQDGGGFLRFEGHDPVTGDRVSNTALVRVVEPWGWVLVATMPDNELQGVFAQERALFARGSAQRWWSLSLALAAALAVALGGSLLFSRWSRRLFQAYHQQHAEHVAALRRQAAELRTLSRAVEQSPVAILITDTEGRIVYGNPDAARISGYGSAEVLGSQPPFLRADDGTAPWLALRHGETWRGERRCERKDGGLLWGRIAVSPIFDEAGAAIQYVAVVEDITERKLHDAEQRIAATAFESQEGMMVADAQGTILKVNRAFSEITGYEAGEAVGQTPRLLNSGRHDRAFFEAMWRELRETGQWRGEIWNRRKSGELYPEWLAITAVRGEDGVTSHYVGTFTDITQRKAAEKEIQHLAFYDPLTGLPNRRMLIGRLGEAQAASARRTSQGALIFLDLDNFKTLNDTLGHDKGDLLLRQVAARLMACARAHDTVARQGGDEFVLILDDLGADTETAARRAESVGEAVRHAVSQPYDLEGYAYHCTPSLGVALFDGREPLDDLLRRADLAMYEAKAAGRNTLRFFDPAMQAQVSARAALEVELRQAIQQDQLALYYQVQVSAAGAALGAEALVRWHHPGRGLVSPAEFIPLAEDTGLILPLGLWVLEAGCRQLAAWARQPGREHLTLAINVSARQYRQHDFVAQVLAVLERTGAPPGRLKLELTESVLLHDVEDIIAKITTLQARGVSFSLDDFGTGYSSLSYLKRLPLDQLKIDQSFVRDLLLDPNDASIARTIIALGKTLGLMVIAEGVETAAQRDRLASYGCDAYQGYLYGRPVPVEVFEQALPA